MKMTNSSRWRHYLAIVGIFLIIAALIAGMAGCNYIHPSKDLEIRDWYDLDAVRDNLAGDHTLMNDLDSTTAGYNELVSPIANGGKGWQPIGSEFSSFTGSFHGQGYEIRCLFINRHGEYCVGLFSTVDEEGVIENIGVVSANVTGNNVVGSLAGFNGGTVSNSYSTGSVTAEGTAGGLVGQSRGTVKDCYSTGSVTGYEGVGGLVGLVGYNNGAVSNSYYDYNEVLINGENIITVGALLSDDFDEWLGNGKFLDVNERLSQEDGYYVVNNVSDFKELLAFGQNATLKFRLKNDLNLAAEPGLYIPYLAGEFDGNGHEISNLSFDSDFVFHVGLFGYLAPGGEITEVGVENVNVTGPSCVGGLVGYNVEGTVSNCHVTGNVTGNVSGTGNERYFGGLVGYNVKGTVSNCYAAANVTGDLWAGGLVGLNDQGTVSNSYSTGSVNGHAEIGGLLGCNYGTVSGSYSTGSVTGEYGVGGLAGGNYGVVGVPGLAVEDFMGSLSNSYSAADVTGEYSVGGLAGGNYGAVGVPSLAVEGFMGSLRNSYSTGNVTGNEEVGGLVGLNDGGTVSNCYSTGSVGGNEDVGGLVGRNYGTVLDSFWDVATSGQATSDGGTGRPTDQMKSITTFSAAGWNVIAVGGSDERDPAYIWNIVNGVTYPFLSWQPIQ